LVVYLDRHFFLNKRVQLESEEIMIRKPLWIVLACVCIYYLAGCHNQQIDNTPFSANQLEEKGSTDLAEQIHSPSQEEKADTYQFKTSIYQNGDLVIRYPQLIKMKDPTKEQQINEWLKKEAIQYVDQYEDSHVTLNMGYQVTINTEDMLSILYTGDRSVKGGPYPTHLLFTTNINIKNEEKIRLSDVVSIDERFIDTFKQSPYMDWQDSTSPNKEKMAAVVEYLNHFTQKELVKAFKQGDDPSMKNNPFGIYSYFTEDFLIVSIQVPHVLGDHAEFTVIH
jgi:hypothetical protein